METRTESLPVNPKQEQPIPERSSIIRTQRPAVQEDNEEDRRAQREAIYKMFHLTPQEQDYAERGLKKLQLGLHFTSASSDEEINIEKVSGAIDQIRNVGRWPVFPSFAEWKEERLEQVQIVVHPCYSIFDDAWNPKLWNEVGKNPEQYIHHFVLAMANTARTAVSKDATSLPNAYLCARDLLEELDALRAAPPPGILRIIDLPCRSFTKDDGSREFLDALLHTVSPERTAVVNSETTGSGELQGSDLAHLKTVMAPQAQIMLQGGYINACLDGACKSVVSALRDRKDVALMIDGGPSTATNAFGNVAPADPILNTEHERGKTLQEIESVAQQSPEYQPVVEAYRKFDRARLSIAQANAPFTNIDEVRSWINSNQRVNSAYDEVIRLKGEITTRSYVNAEVKYR